MRLVLDRVTYAIGQRTVLNCVSHTFESGSVAAVVGPSGSGKTTLLSLIAGNIRADSGSITLSRMDGEAVPVRDGMTCWVPQGNNSLPGRTAVDNAALGALAGGEPRDRALSLARRALDQMRMLPRAEQKARTLSGGELQRVCIARALTSPAPIVVCDEPSSNLDEIATREVADVLRALQTSHLVIVATHDPLIIDAADSVLRLR